MKRFYSDILGKYVLARKRTGIFFGKVMSTDSKTNTLFLKNNLGRGNKDTLVLDNSTLFVVANTIDKFFGEDSEIHFSSPIKYFEILANYIQKCYGIAAQKETRNVREVSVSLTNLVSDTNIFWKEGHVLGWGLEKYFGTTKVDFPTLYTTSANINAQILQEYPNMDTTALCVSVYGKALYIDDTGIYAPIHSQSWKEILLNIVNISYNSPLKTRMREFTIAFHDGIPCLMVYRNIPEYTYSLLKTMMDHSLNSLVFPMQKEDFYLYKINNSSSAIYIKDINTALENMYSCYRNINLYPTIYISDNSKEINVVLKSGTYYVNQYITTKDIALPTINDLISCLRPVNRKDASTIYTLSREVYENRIQLYDTFDNLFTSMVKEGLIKKVIKHFYDIYYIQISNGYFMAIYDGHYRLYRCRRVLSCLEEPLFYIIESTNQRVFQVEDFKHIMDISNCSNYTYSAFSTSKNAKEVSNILLQDIPAALENGEYKKSSYIRVEEDAYITNIEDSFNSVKVYFIYKGKSYSFLYQKETYSVVPYNVPIGWDNIRCAKFILTLQQLFGVSLTEVLTSLKYCIYSYNEGQDKISISKSQPIDTCKSLTDCKRIIKNRKGNNFLVVLFSKESIKAMYKVNKKGNLVKLVGSPK